MTISGDTTDTVAELEFWFDFASPYAYLSACRIDRLAADAHVRLAWRPFLLGPILKSRYEGAPATQNATPAQARYRRRDAERLAQDYDVRLLWPSAFPRGSLLAARVAVAAQDEDWCPAFVRAVFRANFAEDRDIGSSATIGAVLSELGRPADRTIALATTADNKERLVDQGRIATERGIFGAPSFVVARDGELFWGNDRLEQALAWASRRDGAAMSDAS